MSKATGAVKDLTYKQKAQKVVAVKPRVSFPDVGVSHRTMNVMEENERILSKRRVKNK